MEVGKAEQIIELSNCKSTLQSQRSSSSRWGNYVYNEIYDYSTVSSSVKTRLL